MEVHTGLTIQDKLNILADAAKYDVACTSSGSSRRGKKGMLGNAAPAGICHSFAADGRCISLLKILMSNDCVYNCRYCQSRSDNDCPRTTFTPEEICSLVIEFYRRNYIEGLFLSSAVVKSPAYTMEMMCRTIYLLRYHYHFRGYVHVKVIPGAPEDLIWAIGHLSDRLSVNLELPTYEGLKLMAPAKKPEKLIAPVRQIQQGIAGYRLSIGKDARMERHYGNRYFSDSIFQRNPHDKDSYLNDKDSYVIEDFLPFINSENSAVQKAGQSDQSGPASAGEKVFAASGSRPSASFGNSPILTSVDRSFAASGSRPSASVGNSPILTSVDRSFGAAGSRPSASVGNSPILTSGDRSFGAAGSRPFAPAGQSTQMIIGATKETDYQLLMMTQRLYQQFDLKRVFFSAYVPLNDDRLLPSLDTKPPLLREHRLYQADWLLRFYGFRAEELLSDSDPHLDLRIDPKCHWAVRHLEYFPVEINHASYETLMRVPGIGYKSATRIIRARKAGPLDFSHLKKIGVVLKRAVYFITCQGKMMERIPIEEGFITRRLAGVDYKDAWRLEHKNNYRQLSLFDDFNIQAG